MATKQEIISQVEVMNLKSEDWVEDMMMLVETSGDLYALGYMVGKLEEIGAALSPFSEDYREEVIEALDGAFR